MVCEARASSSRTPSAFAPECAVFLNLAPDHLDRHGTIEAYLAAKLRVFANQANEDVAVYNADDPALAGLDLGGCAGGSPSARRRARLRGRARRGHDLLRRRAAAARPPSSACSATTTSPTRWPPPPRRWRWASSATRSRDGLRSFAGVPHRLEPVAEIGGVRFVNDSKATNVASAAVGLRAFEGGVHAILGGSDKGEYFAPLAEPVASAARRLPDRRRRRAAGARRWPPRSRPGSSSTAARTSRTRSGGRRRGARPARSSCSRRPAPASTPSATSSERGERFREIVGALA